MAVSLKGIGIVSALGSGIETLREGIAGTRNPQIIEEDIATSTGLIKLPVFRAQNDGLDNFIPKRALRRVEPFAQMALNSAFLAIQDSGSEIEDKSRLGLIFGSVHGTSRTTFKFLDGIIEDGDKGASPTFFANSVHNSVASQVSISMKATGPCSTITCFNHSVSQAFFMAQSWLQQGMVDEVLVGFGDEYYDVMGYVVANLNQEQVSELNVLNFDSCAYLPGEGHVSFLLSRDDSDSKYGKIERTALNADVNKINEQLDGKTVFAAANGSQESGKAFQKLESGNINLHSHAHLYGSMPLGAPFEIAAAALEISGSSRQTILCAEATNTQRLNLYSVYK